MKILYCPMGTAGDIRPSIAFTKFLLDSGHKVKLIIPKNGENLCKSNNLDYSLINYDYNLSAKTYGKILSGEKSEKNTLVSLVKNEIKSQFDGMSSELNNKYDLVLNGTRNYATLAYSELLNIPYYHIRYFPNFLMSSSYVPWRMKPMKLPKIINTLLWLRYNFKDDTICKFFINPHRKKWGLKPQKNFSYKWQDNTIISVDKELAMVSKNVKFNYWQTDYMYLDNNEILNNEILNFIENKEKVVYLGFGSMPNKKSFDEFYSNLNNIAKKLNIGIITLKNIMHKEIINDKNILTLENVPHQKLFPYMSLNIHHGGAGTTHTAAKSGIPQIIIPQMADQFFWGNHIKSIEIGDILNKFDYKTLEIKIKNIIDNKNIARNAKELGFRLSKRPSKFEIINDLPSIFK